MNAIISRWECEWYGNSTEVYTEKVNANCRVVGSWDALQTMAATWVSWVRGQPLTVRGETEEDGDVRCDENDKDDEDEERD